MKQTKAQAQLKAINDEKRIKAANKNRNENDGKKKYKKLATHTCQRQTRATFSMRKD